MALYKQLSGKHHAHGKVYLPGELVELTEQEAQAFGNKFQRVETPAPTTPEGGEITPPEGGKKGK